MINTQKKKWTLMFFFASDNILSPSMLSQLKALKTAGFQKDTNVLAYFDPNERGAPTSVFQINKNENTGQASQIGDATGPFVSDLAGDNITPQVIGQMATIEARNFAKVLADPEELEATDALRNFLSFCRAEYPADHYMLFLVGHGLIVGRDAFLPDDNPNSAITLKELGDTLRTFSDEIRQKREALELIAMHSCSMSAIEVAYELKDTANYMIASQGISFVGAWPYRRLLIETFNAIERGNPMDVPELMRKLHRLCIHNSADFIFAGYSADLCLLQLRSENLRKLDEPIKKLAKALEQGVADAACRELILLAHWESQSFWQESYTDLYDLCLCLSRSCKDQTNPTQMLMKNACEQVMQMLDPPKDTRSSDGPVLCTDYFGPDCQYSHGLSIFFPWSKPPETSVLANYEKYAFTQELQKNSWIQFLKSYFEATKRKSRQTEDGEDRSKEVAFLTASSSQRTRGVLGGAGLNASTALDGGGKISPPDAGGGECSCLSIKNYPRDFAMSPGTQSLFA